MPKFYFDARPRRRCGLFIAPLVAATLCCAIGPNRAEDNSARPAEANASVSTYGLPVITTDSAALPIRIPATDPKIRYIGRFDTSDPKGPRCEWTNTEVKVAFKGDSINVTMDEGSNSDEYEVVVDGAPAAVIAGHSGAHVYNLFSSKASRSHVVEVVKRTESFFGSAKFTGFQLSPGGKLMKLPVRPKHRLEVIGDSISVAYGNEAKNQYEHFTPHTQNAYNAYGAVASRMVNAEYSCIAWSGRKMWPDSSMPEIYGRIIATEDNSHWNFAKWTPDVIVINLSTNDFGGGAPDSKGWTDGYKAFITRLRGYYPKAVIYCATSPMMGGKQRAEATSYITQIVDDKQAAGDKNVRLIEFATQEPKDGYGADWHPSVKTHQIMAQKLATVLEKEMGWKQAAPPKSR